MSHAFVLEKLIRALEGVGSRYLLGGSLASSSYGLPRATLDTDLLVRMQPHQVHQLAESLGADWYLDEDFAQQSIVSGRAFNVIHMTTGHKFDLFPTITEFQFGELERARSRTLRLPGGAVTCFVATAEDMVLAKLRWYRDGGEVSDRQWSDVMEMLMINRDLDWQYLNRWAAELKVTDLLQKAATMADE